MIRERKEGAEGRWDVEGEENQQDRWEEWKARIHLVLDLCQIASLFFFFEGLATKRWLQFLMKCLCCCTWTPWLSLAHQVQDPRRVIKHADRICMGASHGEEAYGCSKSALFVIRHWKMLGKKDEEQCLFFWLNPDQIFLRFWLFAYITLDDLIWINLY